MKTVQNSKRIVFKFYSAADFNARLIEICTATLATIKPWVLVMFNDEVAYYFDGSMVGLLSCVFRAFQFKELQVRLCLSDAAQHGLFADKIEVSNNEQHAERVWSALQTKLSSSSLKQFYFAYLSESLDAYQHLFNYCIYVFTSHVSIEKDYSNPSVLAIAQWTKKVGREKHRMEAFIRFKKTKDELFKSGSS